MIVALRLSYWTVTDLIAKKRMQSPPEFANSTGLTENFLS